MVERKPPLLPASTTGGRKQETSVAIIIAKEAAKTVKRSMVVYRIKERKKGLRGNIFSPPLWLTVNQWVEELDPGSLRCPPPRQLGEILTAPWEGD